MFLIDNILRFPVSSILWVFKGILHAVEEELVNEADAITTKLSELYMMLETGQMTEVEFDAAEKTLLDRLDAIKEGEESGEDEDEDEDEIM